MKDTGKLGLIARFGEIGAATVQDLVARPKPTDPTVVPPSTTALTTEWLTGALCGEVPGAAVVTFELGALDNGSNARQPVRLTYNEAGRLAGLPERVFAKFTPSYKQRLAGGLTGAAMTEVGFYRDVRPHLEGIEAPRAYYGVADARSCRLMLLMEDISDRVAEYGNPATQYIDRGRAESMVEVLAGLHGGMWDDARISSGLPWLRTTKGFQELLDVVTSFSRREQVGVDRGMTLGIVPGYLVDRRDQIHDALLRSLDLNVQGPQTLVHFDVHLANWYVTTRQSMGLMDWGCLVAGNWAVDFAYAISSALTVEDRRAWEHELLALYLERLAAAGGVPPTFDEAWRAYRQQIFHGLTFWLFTIGYGKLQPKMQPDDVCEAVVHRTAQAVADLRSFEALDETT